jgi:hypothetical protein
MPDLLGAGHDSPGLGHLPPANEVEDRQAGYVANVDAALDDELLNELVYDDLLSDLWGTP